MYQFQADQMAVAEHLYADTATLQNLRDTGRITLICQAAQSSSMTVRATADFDVYLKDAWYWPADLLQDLLDVPSVDVLPFPVGMPMFERSHSIPNELAYVPQVGVDYTTDMVSSQPL